MKQQNENEAQSNKVRHRPHFSIFPFFECDLPPVRKSNSFYFIRIDNMDNLRYLNIFTIKVKEKL